MKSRPIPGSTGEVLTCLPSPYQAHPATGLLYLPRFLAKIRYVQAHGELPKSWHWTSSNADIDAIAKELDDVQSSIGGKRDNVNKIFSCMTRSTTLLKLECNALVGHVDEAHRSVIDLKDQRALAEDNRKEYIRTHARSYRAIYESYLKTRS